MQKIEIKFALMQGRVIVVLSKPTIYRGKLMSKSIEVTCRSIGSISPQSSQGAPLLVSLEEVRADVLMSDLIQEIGVNQALNSFGFDAIANYMQCNGYSVVDLD